MTTLDNLLSTPMQKLDDTGFTQQTMKQIIARQKSFQRTKQTILLSALLLCAALSAIFSFELNLSFNYNFNLVQQLGDLSGIVMADHTLGYLLIATLGAISFFAYESFEN